MTAPAFPPPGQRAPTSLPRAPSESVLAGRELFERVWTYAIAIELPDETTIDDGGRRLAELVREILKAQMESDCAAVCNLCAGLEVSGRWIEAASVAPGTIYDMQNWTHEWGLDGGPTRGYLPCAASKIREAWRKGIWADDIK